MITYFITVIISVMIGACLGIFTISFFTVSHHSDEPHIEYIPDEKDRSSTRESFFKNMYFPALDSCFPDFPKEKVMTLIKKYSKFADWETNVYNQSFYNLLCKLIATETDSPIESVKEKLDMYYNTNTTWHIEVPLNFNKEK